MRYNTMSFIFYNPNPSGKRTGDCVIRAIAKATGQDWERAYTNLCVEGYTLYDLPSSNRVWGSYLQSRNFEKIQLSNTCPDCYTVKQFCEDNPKGIYVLALGNLTADHAVTVIDGNYFDVWDSGDEIPLYYFKRK